MLRYLLAPLAALVLLTASLIPDDAYARRGGGGGFRGGGGGFHGGGFRGGGGMHAGRFHGGGYRGGCVRHIPSQAARVVPDMDTPVVPVVRATRSRAEGTIADRIRRGGSGSRSGWCRGLWRLWRLQQLLRCVRQLDLFQSVSILIRAERMPTAVGPVLTAVPSSDICRLCVVQATPLTEPANVTSWACD